jgi:hypothetical protein
MDTIVKKSHVPTNAEVVGFPFAPTVLSTKNFFLYVCIFQNPKWKQEYAIEINNKFEILENMDDEDSTDNDINKNGKI